MGGGLVENKATPLSLFGACAEPGIKRLFSQNDLEFERLKRLYLKKHFQQTKFLDLTF